MLSKAVNGYSAATVDKVIRGYYGPPEFRYRAELFNRDLQKIRDIPTTEEANGSLNLAESKIFHNSLASDIKRSARLVFIEKNITLDAWSDLVIAQGPLFFHRLAETSGTTANDASGNGRTGTYNGSPTLNQASLVDGDTANASVTFDGTNDFDEIADASWMDVTTQVSWSIWCRADSSVTGARLLWGRDNFSTQRAWIIQTTTTALQTVLYTGGGTRTHTATVAIRDGVRHHIVVTYDGVNLRMYVDGIRVYKAAETNTINAITQPIQIGVVSGAGFWQGELDEAAMWNRALSEAEIRQQWQAGSSDLRQIDFERDYVAIYGAVKMPTNGTDGTPWAEWPLIVGKLSSPNRHADDKVITRDCIVHGLESLLQNDRFGSRHTITGGVNYITGTNGVSSIATTAGFSTSLWSITATALNTPATQDFEIGTSRLEAINKLLVEGINYKPLRFKGDGQGVIEPFVLPEDRAVDDTLAANEEGVIVNDIEEQTEIDSIFNEVVLSRPNPDVSTIDATESNSLITSFTSTTSTGRRNIETQTVAAADQTTLDGFADRLLSAQPTKRIRMMTVHRPFHDDEDKIHFTDTFARTALGFDADCLEESWTLPLHPAQPMEHILRKIESIS